MFSILIKSFVFVAGLIAFAMPTHARLLTSTEMQDFMSVHNKEIEGIHQKHGLHRGYCVVELAKQRMLNNEFSKEDKLKACSYYGNVVLSALSGIGFGGLSKTNQTASVTEHRTAYLALYALGLNLAENLFFDVSSLSVNASSNHRSHYQACNGLVVLGCLIRDDLSRSSAASGVLSILIEKNAKGTKQYDANVLNAGGELYDKYLLRAFRLEHEKGVFSSYIDELRRARVRKESVDDIYANGAGQRDEFRRPPGFGATLPKTESKPKTKSKTPPPSSSPTEPLEPWHGSLYRDLAAANEAMQRGLSEDVCKSTGNLIVRVHGQSTYYSSTATLILQSSGTVMAITNAHCVSSDKGAISSVELHVPGCETIFFTKVYMHHLYKKDSTDSTGYDVALLKGKHARAQPIIEMLPSVMTDEMIGGMGYLVSYAAVNYLENGRIKRVVDCARTLSVQTIERLGSAPLHKAEMPRPIQTQDPMSSSEEFLKSENLNKLPIYFNPKSHRLDAAFSFGCSGSPFFVKIGGISFLAGLLDSGIYRIEAGVPTRSASISSLYAFYPWLIGVKLNKVKPTYTIPLVAG